MASEKNYFVLLQELYSKQMIGDETRDLEKDMILEEDTTLTLLFENFHEDRLVLPLLFLHQEGKLMKRNAIDMFKVGIVHKQQHPA